MSFFSEKNNVKVNQLSSQLAQKMTKNTGAVDPEDFSERALGLVTGTGTVNLLTIPQDKSVTPLKTDFATGYENLLNQTDIVTSSYWSSSVGAGSFATSNAGYARFPKLTVSANKQYTITKCSPDFTWFVDAGGMSINSLKTVGYTTNTDGSYTFTTPANTDRIAITFLIASSTNVMLCIGASLPSDYLPFGKKQVKIPDLILENGSVSSNKLDFVKKYENLINATTIVKSSYYAGSVGSTTVSTSNAGYERLPKMTVEPNTKYTINTSEVNFTWLLDSASKAISNFKNLGYVTNDDGSITFTTPSNCTFISITFNIGKGISAICCKGESIPVGYLGYGEPKINIGNSDYISKEYKTVYLYVSQSYTESTLGWGVTRFSSFITAYNSITDNSISKRYVIVVSAGTYDEFSTYFQGHDVDITSDKKTGSGYIGFDSKNYVTIRAEKYHDRPIFYMDGAYGLTSVTYDDVFKKAIFHVDGKAIEFKIDGIVLQARNCRYSFHHENGTDGYESTTYLNNCVLQYDGDDYAATTGYNGRPLGIGIAHGLLQLDGCKLINPTGTQAVVGHNQAWNPSVKKPAFVNGAQLIFNNCDFGGKSVNMDTYKNDSDGFDIMKLYDCHNISTASFGFQGSATVQQWRAIVQASSITTDNLLK